MSFDCEWAIRRLDGSEIICRTTEEKVPTPGSGKKIHNIPCQIKSRLETPLTPPLYKFSAKEVSE